MRAALCDDEKTHNNHLEELLRDYKRRKEIDIFEISGYTSCHELLEKHTTDKFDFIFLDVDMPIMNGFETAECIREIDLDAAIVFVTRVAEQIPMGYNYNAKQYLCKPVTQEDIDILMDRLVREHLRNKDYGRYSIRLKNTGVIEFLTVISL